MGFLEDLAKAMEDSKKKADEFKDELEKSRKEAEEKINKLFPAKEIKQFCDICGGVDAARDLVKKAEEGKLTEKDKDELAKFCKETGYDVVRLKRAIDAINK